MGPGVPRLGLQYPLACRRRQLNEVTHLPCVAIHDCGGRDPGG